MKILYIGNGLTHYYNLVLSRLNSEPDIEIVVLVPTQKSQAIGQGVYQTQKGINFRVIFLDEIRKFKFYLTFKNLFFVLMKEKPDAIVLSESHLDAFSFSLPLLFARKIIGSKIILKSIPFRYLTYQELLANAHISSEFSSLPKNANLMLKKAGLMSWLKLFRVFLRRKALQLPDAHVNYVEAYHYFESYGISRDKIFITRNSPDTDMLFSIREEIEKLPKLLAVKSRRVLHVGRLVKWKNVDMLIKAFSVVKEKYPDAELVIIGDGPEEAHLKQISSELALEKSVLFLGGVYDQALLGRYFLESNLYVLAGMGGLSINEAMAFGLPILCSECDGTEKALVKEEENGRYFKDGDADDLANKIAWFLDQPDRMVAMGKKSVEIIRNDVNIHTVINGYMRAFKFVSDK